MYWLRTTFREWASKQGIELLKDDINFAEKVLIKLPENSHKLIMRDYAYEWLRGMGDKEKSLQNQNLGRKRANIWLRRQLD
jgi:hypothetical protein